MVWFVLVPTNFRVIPLARMYQRPLEMDIGNGAKKQGLPKLRDLLRRQRGETEVTSANGV